jgi:hypothetical protein
VKQWIKFSVAQSPILRIKLSDNLSRIAVCTQESSNTVTIFESESNTTFSMEQVVQSEEPVNSIQWSGIGDGDDVLCIGTVGKIHCYTNRRTDGDVRFNF